MTSLAFKATLVVVLFASGSMHADAQEKPIEFRMAGAKSNPVGCLQMDSSMTRVHTVTPMGDKAALKSAGGINDMLKQTAPGIYKTTYSLNGARLDITADATKSPKTLEMVEAQRGCHWSAVAP